MHSPSNTQTQGRARRTRCVALRWWLESVKPWTFTTRKATLSSIDGLHDLRSPRGRKGVVADSSVLHFQVQNPRSPFSRNGVL